MIYKNTKTYKSVLITIKTKIENYQPYYYFCNSVIYSLP